jgi:hypothetical protein
MLLAGPVDALLQRPNLSRGWGCNFEPALTGNVRRFIQSRCPSIQAHRHERTPSEGANLL